MILGNINKLINKRRFITSYFVEYTEFAVLCYIATGIPLLVRHPQLVVGILINFTLMVTAVNVRGWNKVIPLIMLPSVAATVSGFLFGAFTIYLVYLIPVIWMGNATLVFIMKYLHVQKHVPYIAVVPIASILKMMVLFSVTFILVFIGVLPNMFLIVMGFMQVTTAVLGGLIAFPIIYGYQYYFSQDDCY